MLKQAKTVMHISSHNTVLGSCCSHTSSTKVYQLTRWVILVGVLATSLSLSQLGWVYAKGYVADRLIARAWQQTQEDRQAHAPWSWADTFPLATITIAGQNQIILSNASMRNLAFGVSADSGREPSDFANQMRIGLENVHLFGHNDTHFSVLTNMQKGDVIELATLDDVYRFEVHAIAKIHEQDTHILSGHGSGSLTLITCDEGVWRRVYFAQRFNNSL
jgi:sortase A